jgi:hypothetical protein
MRLVILSCLILVSFGFAVVEKKGQEYYLQNCSSCHGGGNRGGGLALTREWKEYFDKDAKMLKEFHGDKESKQVIEYLQSETFQKQRRRMLKFLIEFAKDSPTIPSCNS